MARAPWQGGRKTRAARRRPRTERHQSRSWRCALMDRHRRRQWIRVAWLWSEESAEDDSYEFGFLPPRLFNQVPDGFIAFHKAGQTKTTSRTWRRAAGAGRDDGISPDNVHPGEGRYCGEAQAGAIALKGLDITERVGHHGYPDTSHHYYSCSPPWRRRLVRPGTLVL